MGNKSNTPKVVMLMTALVLIVGGAYLGFKGNIFQKKALNKPQNVAVSDVRGGEVTLTWLTADKAESYVYFGNTPALGMVKSVPGSSTSHLVTINDLKPSTTYYFQVGDTDERYSQDGEDGNIPYTFRTLAEVKKLDTLGESSETKQIAVNEPNSPFGKLIDETKNSPKLESKVLAESTQSGGNNGGNGNDGSSGGTVPNGGNTIFTIVVTLIASLLLGFGFKLLKN